MRDNNRQPLRCRYGTETKLQAISLRVQRRSRGAGTGKMEVPKQWAVQKPNRQYSFMLVFDRAGLFEFAVAMGSYKISGQPFNNMVQKVGGF